jgi:hypothetical protein
LWDIRINKVIYILLLAGMYKVSFPSREYAGYVLVPTAPRFNAAEIESNIEITNPISNCLMVLCITTLYIQ